MLGFDGSVGVTYAISVGTLSEVILQKHCMSGGVYEGGIESYPLPPGHVLIMSMSSGVALYTAATPAYRSATSFRHT